MAAAARASCKRRRVGAQRRAPACAAVAAAVDVAAYRDAGPYREGDLVRESPSAGVGYRVERLLGVGGSSFTYLCTIEAAGEPEDEDAVVVRCLAGERVALKAVRAVPKRPRC